MKALPKSSLPEDMRTEMARLAYRGFALIPLGGGDDGKRPLLRGWADKALSLSQVLGPMHSSGVAVYGIRLDGLVVVDCDIDDPELVVEIEARFGPSPVHVLTPRGRHLYYCENAMPPNLRGEGLLVDIKTGPRAYVVGPQSLRPDGGFYEPIKGTLGVDALPRLLVAERTPVMSVARSTKMSTGTRHTELVKKAREMVVSVDTQEELIGNLRYIRDDCFENPATLPDSELSGIASWAWKLRLENRIYTGRQSAFPFPRLALDLLRGLPAQEDAIALYARLLDQHGHSPGKSFPLCHKAMQAAGLTSLSKARFLAARRALERLGLLKLANRHVAGTKMQTFVLALPLSELSNSKKLQLISG